MTEKIKLTKQQAECIDYLNVGFYDAFDDIVRRHLNDGWNNIAGLSALSKLNLKELTTALLVGYEVEYTPEETINIVYDYYKNIATDISQSDNRSKRQQFSAFCDGIDFTLVELGKKGVGITQSNLFEKLKQAATDSSNTVDLIEEEMEAHDEALKLLARNESTKDEHVKSPLYI